MGKDKISVLVAFLLLFSASVAFAQSSLSSLRNEKDDFSDEGVVIVCKALEALKESYGFIATKFENSSEIVLTFSVPYVEIENMLTTVVSNNWYPESLSILGSTKTHAAISLKISDKQNDSYRRFRVLQKLSAPGVLPWKLGKLDNKEAYVTSIQTDFGSDFLIKGESIKSGLIFKNLTPKISRIGSDQTNLDSERFSSKKNFDRKMIFTRETYEDNDTGINGQPFFERGTYKEDSEIGRYMEFTLRCQW